MSDARRALARWLDAMPLADNPGAPAGAHAAAGWARWLADARAVADLESGLAALLRSDDDPVRRGAAAMALGYVGARHDADESTSESVHAALRAALAGDVALVAMEAAAALGRRGDAADAPALCAALMHADANVRANACTALASLGGSAARAGLHAAAGDPDAFVRAAASEALRRLGEPGGTTTTLAYEP